MLKGEPKETTAYFSLMLRTVLCKNNEGELHQNPRILANSCRLRSFTGDEI